MAYRVQLALADDVAIDGPTLRSRVGVTRFSDAALAAMLNHGATPEELAARGTAIRGRTVAEVLAVLHGRCMLTWRLLDDVGTVQLTATPRRRWVPWPEAVGRAAPREARPSRFTLLRPADRHGWLLESGVSDWQLTLTTEAAAAVTAGESEVLSAIGAFGMLDAQDANPALTTWEFHDRYFASRSRLDLGGGGTFRFAGRVPPVPALEHPAGVGSVVDLPTPSARPDVSFWEVTEGRRTIRTFAADPFPLTDLADLLWHTVRVREVRTRAQSGPHAYDAVFKPVPSAGATHAINTWLVTSNVAGLPDGTWWYDPQAHALRRAGGSTPAPERPYQAPVLILLTSRHARLAWKYEAMAYSLALKDVGVIMHAFQLTGTALGIGVVPLGSGPVTSVAATLGIDPLIHVPVGELAIGTPAGD